MPPTPSPAAPAAAAPGLSPTLGFVFALACGLIVANIYYAQPLVGPVAAELGMRPELAGLIMTLTQLGYGSGLLLLVPLADIVENRRLIVTGLGVVTLGLIGVAGSASALTFMAASFVVGLGAVSAQVLVPMASHLAPEASRGRVVGNIMAGLLAGIMLARPVSSSVAALFGWRAVFALSALLMATLAVVLWRLLPQRRPAGGINYGRMLASLPSTLRHTPMLRRRALYQGALFTGFQAFWTSVPLLLAKEFGFSQQGIALFAFAGAGGALAAPLAGQLADRGLTRPATGFAIASVVLAFGLSAIAAKLHSIAGLLIAAIWLDAAVQLCQVLSLRSMFVLAPEQRGRLNGLFMTFLFICGATGSGLAAALYAAGGWSALCALGAVCAAAALLYYATERRA